MAEDLGEKTEAATPKKLSEARRKGQVAKSTDLSAAAGLVIAAIALFVLGPGWADRSAGMIRRALEMDLAGDAVSHGAMVEDATRALSEGATILWLPMLLFLLVAGATQIAQVGPLLTFEPLKPKLNRLSPLSGVKKIVGKQNAGKTVLSLLKLSLVITVTVLVIYRLLPTLLTLASLPLGAVSMEIRNAALELIVWLLATVVAMGILDLIWQKYNHKEQLKMTKQEVRDERRSVEGDPMVKQRQQQFMRDVARQRVNEAVPDADVIVTNPTHYSVAIKYDGEHMNAPTVVAKGVDYLAWRIRQIAVREDVPIVERPPLARALYAHVDVGEEVHPEHYEAVAEILAYVYRLDREEAAA